MNMKQEILDRMKKKRPTRVFSYLHGGGRIGVLLEIESDTDFALKNELMEKFALEVCLQIASMSPVSVDTADCEARSLAHNSIDDEVMEARPEIRKKILDGRMVKWDKENILLQQPWIKDNKQTILGLLGQLRTDMGEDIKIEQFARFGE